MKFLIKEWAKENWQWIVITGLILLGFAGYLALINNDFCQRWFSKPAAQINIGDIVFIVMLHGWMNRTTVNAKK